MQTLIPHSELGKELALNLQSESLLRTGQTQAPSRVTVGLDAVTRHLFVLPLQLLLSPILSQHLIHALIPLIFVLLPFTWEG